MVYSDESMQGLSRKKKQNDFNDDPQKEKKYLCSGISYYCQQFPKIKEILFSGLAVLIFINSMRFQN